MTDLETWLKRATRSLSIDSAAQVRAEIEEHFAASREAAMRDGASGDEAGCQALAALGDAGAANRQYRRVLLTAREARYLRERGWNPEADYRHGWLRWFVSFWGVAAAGAGIWAWIAKPALSEGPAFLTGVLLLSAVALGLYGLPMFVSLFTPKRSRIYRAMRLAFMLCIIILGLIAFKPSTWWILSVTLGPALWAEWTRMSIRRKMPADRWPKHLYL
ncbi:MAG TPA: hypothetical protein VN151_12140 [Terracidiphilus sp.]|nr:hypothetical protein [Terracidiphilus sp.]